MEQKGHPKGLYLLFATETAERFSYYGMRALFTLYMMAALFTKDQSSQIFGSYAGLVYLTPLLGGYIADRFWGNRRSIIVGGLVMALGQFLMFLSACVVKQSITVENGVIDSSVDNSLATLFMFGGLAALIMGNGFFKPNISTMVGDLYAKTDKRKDSAFTIFYMGVNIGGFLSPIVCGGIGEGNWNDLSPFKWGFLVACVAMLIAVAVFALLKNKYLRTPDGKPIGLPTAKQKIIDSQFATSDTEDDTIAETSDAKIPARNNSRLRIILCLLGLAGLFVWFSWSSESFNDYISAAVYAISIMMPVFIITDKTLSKTEKSRIGVIYIIALFVIVFWAAFEQAGISLTFIAKDLTDRNIMGWDMPTSYFQCFNSFFVIMLAPLAAMLWQWLSRRNREPASPVKQAIGLGLLAVGYLIIAFAVKDLGPGLKISWIWLVILYLLHTLGELALSPIGLSMVNKLSPARFASLLMGVWFMSNSTSNILAGNLSTLYPVDDNGNLIPGKELLGFPIESMYDFFMIFVIMAGVAALLLLCLCPLLKKMMKGVE